MTTLAAPAPGRLLARVPRGPLVVIMVAAFVGAVALPLLTYTVSLAAFGIAHVIAEMRYVDVRFGRRIARPDLVLIGVALAGVVVARVLGVTGVLPGTVLQPVELLFVIGLAAIPIPALRARGGKVLVTGLLVSGALVVALAVDPVLGLLALAVLHNATPIGFLVEAAPSARRGRVLAVALLVFVALPAVIATGVPAALLDGLGARARDLSVLPTGVLADHYKVYLPRFIATRASAEHLFSGIVFAQCMHYAAVIHVLPRLLDDDAGRGLVSWPSKRMLVGGLFIVGGAFFMGFTASFGDARSIYGIFAAVHAWVEVPVLLLAMVLAVPPATGGRASSTTLADAGAAA